MHHSLHAPPQISYPTVTCLYTDIEQSVDPGLAVSRGPSLSLSLDRRLVRIDNREQWSDLRLETMPLPVDGLGTSSSFTSGYGRPQLCVERELEQ